jgi:hypothetical protein
MECHGIDTLPDGVSERQQTDHELCLDEDNLHAPVCEQGLAISTELASQGTQFHCRQRRPVCLVPWAATNQWRGGSGLGHGYASSLLISASSSFFIILSMIVMICWRDHAYFGRWSHTPPLVRTCSNLISVCNDELNRGGKPLVWWTCHASRSVDLLVMRRSLG